MIVAFGALVLATAASLAPPYLAKLAIDDGITPGDLAALNLIVAAFVGSALLTGERRTSRPTSSGGSASGALQDLRLRIFTHLQRQSIGFFSRRKTGVLISRLTNDVQALDQLVTDGIVTLFSSSLTLIGTVVILLLLDVSWRSWCSSPPSRSWRSAASRSATSRRAPTARCGRRSRTSPRTSGDASGVRIVRARSARSRATSSASRS